MWGLRFSAHRTYHCRTQCEYMYACLIRMPNMHALYVCFICMPYMYALYACLIRMSNMHALYVCLICMPYMYALYVCLICMPYMYALHVCLIRTPYMHALYVGLTTAADKERREATLHRCVHRVNRTTPSLHTHRNKGHVLRVRGWEGT